METFVGILVGFLVLMILVILHEFGHFLVARRNGVRVLEFGIGFYPRAVAWVKDPATHKWRRLKRSEWAKPGVAKAVGFDGEDEGTDADGKDRDVDAKGKSSGKRKGGDKSLAKHVKNTKLTVKSKPKLVEDGMIFSINWLPIGGFCQMDGENASDERPGTFGAANFWAKTKILFAGVAMNWLAAFVILTVLAWTGMPDFIDNQFTVESDTRTTTGTVTVARVVEDSPASKAGILVGDQIVAVNGEAVTRASQVTAENEAHAGEEVQYKIYRRGDPGCNCDTNLELVAKLNGSDADYLLGIAMRTGQTMSYSTWSAPVVGAGLTLQLTGETFQGTAKLIGDFVSGAFSQLSFDGEVRESGREKISEVGDSVSGPVGIVGVLFPSFTSAGPANLAFLAAVISISLACMNVLPIPALDGGRWLLIAIYKLRRKKLTREIEERIVARAFVVLLALIAVVTILDVTRFFK
ncbi:site-2 protease family protein [Candidatus Saccharibacteria bacterium]|nr:site-2 protease family protein [Candidatus Saccharibacteria bacterium]